MTTEDIIIHIFCLVDELIPAIMKHPQAKLYPSELVTIGILFALRGSHFRAFYRWLKRDYDRLFGGLPDRTRLLRLLRTHQDWCDALLEEPTFFTVVDSFPVELIFPIREGRSKQQIGRRSKDKGRWSIGVKLCWMINDLGRVVAWKWLPMNAHDRQFNDEIEKLNGQTISLSDLGFRCADGVPENLKLCEKNTWNERMIVETVFSLLTVVCDMKKIFHRLADYIEARFAYVAAMFNILLSLFHQLYPDLSAHKISIAEIRCQERQVSSERVVLASRRGQEVGCKGVSQVLHGVNMTYAAVLGSPQAFAPALWKVAVEQDIPDADESSVTADGAE